MPEGDTIFRAAGTLHRALAGAPVVRFESVFPALTRVHEDAPVTGRTVESVRSVGKHILMSYLPPEHAVAGGQLAVEYMGERFPVTVAVVGSTPLFDPENERVRSAEPVLT